jgi:hypothetical protein
MSNTAPKVIEDPAMKGMCIEIAHRLNGLSGISLGAIAESLSEGRWFESTERYAQGHFESEVDIPESCITTVGMRYRAAWGDVGVSQVYHFSLNPDSEDDSLVYPDKYVLLLRASGGIILQTLQGIDVEWHDATGDLKVPAPGFRPATNLDVRGLQNQLSCLQDIPNGGVHALVPA